MPSTTSALHRAGPGQVTDAVDDCLGGRVLTQD
jgi:hypothetical protein